MFEYEKVVITRTRVRISLGGIAAVAILILVATHHKTVGSDIATLVKIVAITLGTAVVLGIIGGIFGIRAARKRRQIYAQYRVPTPTYRPNYVINSQPVAEIAPTVVIDGEEYVRVIKPNKLTINSQYGKGRPNA